jgi:Mce-associated membrane protein
MATRRDVCSGGGEANRKAQRVTDNKGVKLKSVPDESPTPDAASPEADQVHDPANTEADASVDETADTTAKATDDGCSDDLADEQAVGKTKDAGRRAQRRLSISVSARSLLYALLVAVLVGALATFVWLYIGARHELDTQARKSNNNARAETIALDYAVNAATMNYQDLNGWKTKLVAGTSPELNDKLSKAAESMQQILVPLQWTSSARPLIAKVRSNTAGIYVVDCFVSVQTKTMQAPDPLMSTATYSLTLDSNKNWQITDVGGIGALTGQR